MHPTVEMQQMMEEYEQQLEEAVIKITSPTAPQEAIETVLAGLGLSRSLPHVLKETHHAVGR